MSGASALMAVIRADPTSTTELYGRVGYPSLARLGLIPHPAYREQLVALADTGVIESQPGRTGRRCGAVRPKTGLEAGHILARRCSSSAWCKATDGNHPSNRGNPARTTFPSAGRGPGACPGVHSRGSRCGVG